MFINKKIYIFTENEKKLNKTENIILSYSLKFLDRIYFYPINVSCESTRKEMQDMRSVFGCRGFVYECKFKIKYILKSRKACVRSHFTIFSPSAISLVFLVVFIFVMFFFPRENI